MRLFSPLAIPNHRAALLPRRGLLAPLRTCRDRARPARLPGRYSHPCGRSNGGAKSERMETPMRYWCISSGQRQFLPGTISRQCDSLCTVTRTGRQLDYAGYLRAPKIYRTQSTNALHAEMRTKIIMKGVIAAGLQICAGRVQLLSSDKL